MTRVIVYSTALLAFLAATALTFAAIVLPDWMSWNVTTSTGSHLSKKIGLHRSCSSVDSRCRDFPSVLDDCSGSGRYFCSMWRSVGFLMSFTAVLEIVTIVTYGVILVGGKQKRQNGWKLLAFLLSIVGLAQLATTTIVAYLFDNDERFFVGWRLDKSFVFCTVSGSIALLSAVAVALSAYLFPDEADYELIPSERSRN
ncbi:hypothetical protein F5884DRAFT_68639 [Xylogone sp. PMI_703]|nr:hypothetical protein F5884DRAFT_68639 [Xylogone sp. PMI_703]